MKLILLPTGESVKVDDLDYERLRYFKWHRYKRTNTPIIYAKRSVYENGKTRSELMHRLIMGCPKGLEIDHENHDGLDNQRANLRVCSIKDNRGNRRLQQNSTTGFIGVRKVGKKWDARIYDLTKTVCLGIFTTPEEAAEAYDRAALELRGVFAKLNFIKGYPPAGEK